MGWNSSGSDRWRAQPASAGARRRWGVGTGPAGGERHRYAPVPCDEPIRVRSPNCSTRRSSTGHPGATRRSTSPSPTGPTAASASRSPTTAPASPTRSGRSSRVIARARSCSTPRAWGCGPRRGSQTDTAATSNSSPPTPTEPRSRSTSPPPDLSPATVPGSPATRPSLVGLLGQEPEPRAVVRDGHPRGVAVEPESVEGQGLVFGREPCRLVH